MKTPELTVDEKLKHIAAALGTMLSNQATIMLELQKPQKKRRHLDGVAATTMVSSLTIANVFGLEIAKAGTDDEPFFLDGEPDRPGDFPGWSCRACPHFSSTAPPGGVCTNCGWSPE